MQPAEAEVAVGDERTHAEFLGGCQGLAVPVLRRLHVWRRTVRGDLVEHANRGVQVALPEMEPAGVQLDKQLIDGLRGHPSQPPGLGATDHAVAELPHLRVATGEIAPGNCEWRHHLAEALPQYVRLDP